MTFSTEHNWDSLDFYDGVDSNAPRLGSYSGKIFLPKFDIVFQITQARRVDFNIFGKYNCCAVVLSFFNTF